MLARSFIPNTKYWSMKCIKNGCTAEFSFRDLVKLSLGKVVVCKECGAKHILANKRFIFFLIVLLISLAITSTIFLLSNTITQSLGVEGYFVGIAVPWVTFFLIFGVLVIPALEVKVQN